MAAHLDSGLVKLNVVQLLLVAAELALQFVHTDGFLSERVQLIAVGPSRPSIRQQLVALGGFTAKYRAYEYIFKGSKMAHIFL